MKMTKLLFNSASTKLVAASAMIAGASTSAANAQDRPNVILILVDDMGWSDVGFNGSKFYETPNLDNFAKIATKFTNGYSACAVSSPARASLMTGQYPSRVGITDWLQATQYDENPDGSIVVPADSITKAMMHKFLDNKMFNLAKAFKSKGYTTCHVGKWHLGGGDYEPEKLQGFDFNYGGGHIGHPQSYFYPWDDPNKSNPVEGLPAKPGEYLTDVLTNKAVDFINTHKGEPFFLNLWQYGVHAPVQAKQTDIDYFKSKYHDPNDVQKNDTYAGMVKSIDESFAAVYKTLKDNNLLDNTIIIFTSDNGHERAYSTSPVLRGAKGDPYEGGIREPYLIYWPGVNKPGAVSNAVISGQDIMPTLCNAIGAQIPSNHQVDGIDIRKYVANPSLKSDRTIFWHYPHYWSYGVTPYSAVREGDWKLIKRYTPESYELYNISRDMGEKSNLINVYPEKAKELKDKLLELLMNTNSKIPMSTRKNDKANLIDQEAATFTGNWNRATSALNVGTTLRTSTTKGDFFEYNFNGSGIELFGNLNPSYGDLEIYVDGKYQTLLHQRSESAYNNLSMLKIDNLSGGAHTLKAVVATSGKIVNIDAFQVINYTFSPKNGSKNLSPTTDLSISFSEPVSVVANKKLYIKSGDAIVQTIDLSSIAPKNFSVLNIPLTNNLQYNTNYHIEIDDNAFVGSENNYYRGISNATTWSFKTMDMPSGNYGWNATKGNYLDFGTNGPVVTGNYTIEMWIKPDGNNGGYNGLIGYNPGNNNQRSPFINLYNNTNIEYGFGAGTAYYSTTTTTNVITSNAWNHLAVTFNGTNMLLYVNGVLVNTYAGASGKVPYNTPVRFLNLVKPGAVSFSGVLDEVRVWNTSKTQTEIKNSMYLPVANPDKEASLIGYWNMNKSMNDLSKRAVSGTINANADYVPVNYDAQVFNVNSIPQIKRTYPADNSEYVAVSPKFHIVFSDTVKAVNGHKIRLFSLDGNAIDSINATALSGLNTDSLSFSFSNALQSGKGYFIQIDKGSFVGNKGGTFAGTFNQKDWTFFTGKAHLNVPMISWLTPATESNTVDTLSTFKIGFTKNVTAKAGKYIQVFSSSGNLFDTVNATSLLGSNNDTLSFKLNKPLQKDSSYYILVDDAAFTDEVGNPAKGIAYYWQWNFTTKGEELTAIQLVGSSAIKCYPNPFNNDLTVELPTETSCPINICDIQGKVIYSRILYEKQNHISTSNLPHGLYFLKIADKNKTVIKLIRK